MVLPDSCEGLAGKRLEGGKLEIQGEGNAEVKADLGPWLVDADGDGADEALAVLYCDLGGVQWPDHLVLVKEGGELVDSARVDELFETNEVTTINSFEESDAGVELAGSVKFAGDFAATVGVENGKIVVTQMETGTQGNSSDQFEGAEITMEGLGPISLGMSGQELIDLGFATKESAEGCTSIGATPELVDRGIGFQIPSEDTGEKLWEMRVTSPAHPSMGGARVGMSEEELQEAHGGTLSKGNDFYDYYLESDGRTMTFMVEGGKVEAIEIYDATFDIVEQPRGYC